MKFRIFHGIYTGYGVNFPDEPNEVVDGTYESPCDADETWWGCFFQPKPLNYATSRGEYQYGPDPNNPTFRQDGHVVEVSNGACPCELN